MPQAAATSPNARCRVRSAITAASRASSRAPTSAAVLDTAGTSFGLPSVQPMSRGYQYGFPLITFMYRLATLYVVGWTIDLHGVTV